jgi:FkbM family methyltransferase
MEHQQDAVDLPKTCAQYGEDLILWRALGHIASGFYIDVGAMHPDEHSVTRIFHDRGWHGVNVEPCKRWFDLLCARRPEDVNLQACVSTQPDSIEFFEVAESGLSTTIPRYAQRYVDLGMSVTRYPVSTMTLAEICDRYAQGCPIHFLKIDVEGGERSVIESGDFSRYRPYVVAVEATEPCTYTPAYAEWEPLLLSQGYKFALADEINRYYAANEHPDVQRRLEQQ